MANSTKKSCKSDVEKRINFPNFIFDNYSQLKSLKNDLKKKITFLL